MDVFITDVLLIWAQMVGSSVSGTETELECKYDYCTFLSVYVNVATSELPAAVAVAVA